MPTPDPDTTVRRFVDGELSEDELQEALHQIADDPEARSLLLFELQMTQDLAAAGSTRPSAAFAAETMEQVKEADSTGSSLQSRLRRWWRSLSRPVVTIPVRPASALATLTIVTALVWFVWPTPTDDRTPVAEKRTQQTTPSTAVASTRSADETVWTRFVYMTDDANSVAVAGDFSDWEPISLSPRAVNDNTVWTGLVPVPRGEHEYQFVIDGEKWVTDPLAPVKHDDGFGAKNAVLKL